MHLRLPLGFGLCVLLLGGAGFAHGPLSARIGRVSKEIAQAPAEARLYLKRGELHRFEGHAREAERDFLAAERLAPAWISAPLARAKLLLEVGRAREAARLLARIVRANPAHADGWLYQARALAQLGRHRQAARAYRRAVAFAEPPAPAHYLEAARAHRAAGALRPARHVLDEGIRRLGPIVNLDLAGLEIDLALGRFADALLRIERQMARAARAEPWLLRKAEVLLRAGRRAEAREALRSARAALQRLPPSRRAVAATRALETRIESALRGLGAPDAR
jgi:predicted Zn-dependent protease